MSRLPAVAQASCSILWKRMAHQPHRACGGRPRSRQDGAREGTGQRSLLHGLGAAPARHAIVEERDQPIDVYTTIDLKLQRAAVDALRANAPGGAQGALVSLDRDGAVRAMVGGLDYVSSNYNRAVTAGASARIGLQVVRLPDGARGRLHAGNRYQRWPGHNRWLEPAQRQPQILRRHRCAHGLCLFDQYRGGEARHGGRLPQHRQHGAPDGHQHNGQHLPVDGARHVGRAI